MSRAPATESENPLRAETIAACRREFVAVARSFWLIPEIIPPRQREDVSLLYCFCRRLDDAVDEAASPAQARKALAEFRDELQGRSPPRPLIEALLFRAGEDDIPIERAELLFEGMESDLGLVRFADDDALLRYAYQVSASVALMTAPLLSVIGSAALARVVDVALALQLTNILLGVRDDARHGRVYLPASRLAAAGLCADDVLRAPDDPRVAPVLQGLADLARRYYQSGEAGASLVPLRYRHGILLLGRVYGWLGDQAAQGLSGTLSAPRSPLAAKARGLAAIARDGFCPRVLGLTAPPPHDPLLHRAIAGWPGAHASPQPRIEPRS